MAPDLSALTVDVTNPVPIPSRVELVNMSDEAMVVAGGEVYTFHEINGPAVNPDPVAHRFSADLQLLGTVTCPALEYRITDATEVDADGRFWVVNYFYPGDRELIRPGPDALRQRDGAGPTHRRCQAVERLVEFQLRGGEVICTDTPVIQLQLLGDEQCRNWEGVVRLDGRGFLLVTDEYPRTILAFVPAP
jgi:hypothetical protein